MRGLQASTIFLSAALLVSAASAQLSIGINRTLQVAANGTSFENCTALREVLDSIDDASAANRYHVRLEPGTYNCGTSTLFIPEGVTVEGFGREQSLIVGTIDHVNLGVVHLVSNTTLRSLAVENFHSNPIFGAIAVSVWHASVSPNSVQIEHSELDAANGLALFEINANIIVRFSEILSTMDLSGGNLVLRYSVIPTGSPFSGMGFRSCAFCTNFVPDHLNESCVP